VRKRYARLEADAPVKPGEHVFFAGDGTARPASTREVIGYAYQRESARDAWVWYWLAIGSTVLTGLALTMAVAQQRWDGAIMSAFPVYFACITWPMALFHFSEARRTL